MATGSPLSPVHTSSANGETLEQAHRLSMSPKRKASTDIESAKRRITFKLSRRDRTESQETQQAPPSYPECNRNINWLYPDGQACIKLPAEDVIMAGDGCDTVPTGREASIVPYDPEIYECNDDSSYPTVTVSVREIQEDYNDATISSPSVVPETPICHDEADRGIREDNNEVTIPYASLVPDSPIRHDEADEYLKYCRGFEKTVERYIPSISENITIDLSSQEVVTLKMKLDMIHQDSWWKDLHLTYTHNGVKVAFGHAAVINRELIRHCFYRSMGEMNRSTSHRISEILDESGSFRDEVKNHYVAHRAEDWDQYLDEGALLQVDVVYVRPEWRRQGLGGLVVNTLMDKAKVMEPSLTVAYVLPGPDGLWRRKERNPEIHAFFRDIGFSQVAETGWFANDVRDGDHVHSDPLEQVALSPLLPAHQPGDPFSFPLDDCALKKLKGSTRLAKWKHCVLPSVQNQTQKPVSAHVPGVGNLLSANPFGGSQPELFSGPVDKTKPSNNLSRLAEWSLQGGGGSCNVTN
jgi:GNAT superfamily N-acetyltransferase